MSFSVIEQTLASAVAAAGTFTSAYPSGKNAGNFYLAMGHKLVIDGNVYNFPGDFDVTLGTSEITITNKTSTTWPQGGVVRLQMEEQGKRAYRDGDTGQLLNSTVEAPVMLINLGAPDTADTDGVCTSEDLSGASAGDSVPIDGAAASDGVATLDVPRNVTLTNSTNDESDKTFTVTGTDAYGNAVVEEIAGPNNDTSSGKKAFKTVTSVTVSAATIGAVSVGFGDVLGLPVFLPGTGNVLQELEDGAAPTAGTLVAGVRTAGGATATDGDVRGTYDPNSAADGSKVFQLVAALPDPGYIGITQYSG